MSLSLSSFSRVMSIRKHLAPGLACRMVPPVPAPLQPALVPASAQGSGHRTQTRRLPANVQATLRLSILGLPCLVPRTTKAYACRTPHDVSRTDWLQVSSRIELGQTVLRSPQLLAQREPTGSWELLRTGNSAQTTAATAAACMVHHHLTHQSLLCQQTAHAVRIYLGQCLTSAAAVSSEVPLQCRCSPHRRQRTPHRAPMETSAPAWV